MQHKNFDDCLCVCVCFSVDLSLFSDIAAGALYLFTFYFN